MRLNIPFGKVRNFLTEQALPFWMANGFYDNGCFVEHFDLAGQPVYPGYTRTRVQARQIYVFSHLHQAGLVNAPHIGANGARFLIKSAWLGPQRGWAKLIGRDGSVIDAENDLYDISFALFALAWAYQVDPSLEALKIAHETLDFLEANMKHPLGGYFNDAANSLPRQQNPHMHLTEAMNAWFETSGDVRFSKTASDLITLFSERFYDNKTGALGEFFNEDWSPAPGHQGNIVEPGHQFEWAWIIGHYGRLSGNHRHDLVNDLLSFGMKHGFDKETGITIDQVGRDGSLLSSNRRLWPQTEALKGCLAAAEFLGIYRTDEISKIVNAIFDNFLEMAPFQGAWLDHFDADWKLIVDKVPTSSLYHLTLAFLELLRLQGVLEMNSTKAVAS